MCFETAFPVFAACEVSCRFDSSEREVRHVVEGGAAHMARIRAKSCAEAAEHEPCSHGGGRESVSLSFRGAREVVVINT